MTTNSTVTLQPKAAWERIVSALTFLILVINPAAVLFGLVLYCGWRKRRPFIAFHGLQAAGWQLGYNAVSVVLIICYKLAWLMAGGGLLPGLSSKDFEVANSVQNTVLSDPLTQIPLVWPTLAFPIHLLVGAVAALLLVNVCVAIWGMVLTSRGKTARVPLIGKWLSRPFIGVPAEQKRTTPAVPAPSA